MHTLTDERLKGITGMILKPKISLHPPHRPCVMDMWKPLAYAITQYYVGSSKAATDGQLIFNWCLVTHIYRGQVQHQG